MLEQMILGDHEDSENSLKRMSPSALSATERGEGRDPEHCAPDATRGCTDNTSLNTGANCKRYICTVLYNVM
jgi:hypothetical protein